MSVQQCPSAHRPRPLAYICHLARCRTPLGSRPRRAPMPLVAPARHLRQNRSIYHGGTHAWLSASLQQETCRTGEELRHYQEEQSQPQHFQHRYSPRQTCEGRIQYHEYVDPVDPAAAAPRTYLRCVLSIFLGRRSLTTPPVVSITPAAHQTIGWTSGSKMVVTMLTTLRLTSWATQRSSCGSRRPPPPKTSGL
jgi:hypothetical protein